MQQFLSPAWRYVRARGLYLQDALNPPVLQFFPMPIRRLDFPFFRLVSRKNM
jgi:hypothetical protein